MWHLYLDESGDLGFNFVDKNPSRFLTISILAISQREVVKGIDCAVKKTLRRKVNRKKQQPEQELKGAASTIEVKRHFYEQISDLPFGVYALTVEKCKVYERLWGTPQKKSRFYNFVARKTLDAIPFEQANVPVEIIVDKSKSGPEVRDFNQYVRANLESRMDPSCNVQVYHRQSCVDRVLSAADLFCWGVFRRHERSDEEWYSVYCEKVLHDERWL